MTDAAFVAFHNQLERQGIGAALESLVRHFREERKYHELFEALKMQLRHSHGMVVLPQMSGPADQQLLTTEYEDGLIAACREVGMLLLGEGRLREAWMYLRPVGDKAAVLEALDNTSIPDDRTDEAIEICLYEGLDPVRAFQLMLAKYGTCNTLTTFESQQGGLDRGVRQQVARLLVRHMYDELLGNVRAHVERHEGAVPEGTLSEILTNRSWLTEGGNYHIDVSHLSATVRGARALEDQDDLRLARQLADYGQRLDATLQYADEEPFVENYPAHLKFFDVLLGQDVDDNLAYFRERAEQVDAHYEGTGAIEYYVDLLLRVGRAAEALEEAIEKLPPGTHVRGIAPPIIEIARRAGRLDRAAQLFREQDDLLGYAAAKLLE
jgi:hypothetical protein